LLLAIINKKVSSEIGFRGIFKKVLIFVMVALGNIIDRYVICTGSTLRTMLNMFCLSNEEISILENTGKMGLPFPEKLKATIQQLKDKENKN